MQLQADPSPLVEFHAHIYYHLHERAKATALHDNFRKSFESQEVKVGDLVHRSFGPHPLPMFEVNFGEQDFQRIADWLSMNRGKHTVLIHEVTGDDIRDHTTGATWLGVPLLLKFNGMDEALREFRRSIAE